MSKYMVWVHTDGALRFAPLNLRAEGLQSIFEARCVSGVTTMTSRNLDVTALEPSLPLFLREYFGDGAFDVLGHCIVPADQEPLAALSDFARRVHAAVAGRRGCCIDDRNRVVFWKTVDFLAQRGDLALMVPADLITRPFASPSRFNF